MRTLGSELGSNWADERSDDDDDDGEGGGMFLREYDEYTARHDDHYEEGEEFGEEEEIRRAQLLSRRTLALSELGLPASFNSSLSSAPHLRYAENDFDDDDNESITSDFSHIARNDRERSDYYPQNILARYHPRMVVMRLQDKALQQAAELILYLRFFLLLGLAIIWALWQYVSFVSSHRGRS
jgi:hypothetical protein